MMLEILVTLLVGSLVHCLHRSLPLAHHLQAPLMDGHRNHHHQLSTKDLMVQKQVWMVLLTKGFPLTMTSFKHQILRAIHLINPLLDPKVTEQDCPINTSRNVQWLMVLFLQMFQETPNLQVFECHPQRLGFLMWLVFALFPFLFRFHFRLIKSYFDFSF